MSEKIGLEAVLQMRAFRSAASEYNSLVDDMNRQTTTGAGGITQTFSSMSDSALRVAGILGGALVAGATAAAAALAGIAVSGTKMAIEMEQQVANIAAVMGKTKDEIQPLSDLIVDLGIDPKLKVTADEAAEAIELLARNGLTMTEIMDGAAYSTVLLANSTGTTFGNAANIATDAMAIFNIEAADMEDAVDGIVSVTQNSKFTIDDFALALANGGAVAKASGVDFDDFNTAVAALAPQFASGATAGTGLKNMLLRLSPTTEKASDFMNELGIVAFDAESAMSFLRSQGIEPLSDSNDDLTKQLRETAESMGETFGDAGDFTSWLDNMGFMQNQFFDSSGQMKDMDDVAQILQDTFGDLSEEERNVALNAIFGRDAMGAVIGLMELGADSGEGAAKAFQELQSSMGDTSAAESAATKMDTLAGVLEIIEGLIDSFKLSIGQAFLPMLRSMADRLLVLVNDVGPQVIAFFEGIATFISTFVDELMNGEGALAGLMNALRAVGVPEDVRIQIYDIVTAVQDFITIAAEFVSEHSDAFIGAIKAIGIAFAGLAIAGVVTSLLALVNPVTLIITAIGLLGAAWAENWGDIQGKTATAVAKVQQVIAFVQPYIQSLATFLQEKLGTAVNNVRAWFEQNWPMIQAVVLTAWEVIQGVIQAALSVIEPAISMFVENASAGLSRFQPLLGMLGQLWEQLKPIVLGVLAAIGAALLAAVGVVVGVVEGISFALEPLLETFRNVAAGVMVALGGLFDFISGFFQLLVGLFQGNSEQIQAAWTQMKQGLIDIVGGLVFAVKEAISGLVETVIFFIAGLVDGVVEFFTNLYETLVGGSIIPDMVNAIIEWITSLKDDFIKLISDLWAGIVKTFDTSVATITEIVSDLVEDIKGFFTDTNWAEVGQKIIDGIVQALMNGVGAISDAARSAAEAALQAAKDFLGIDSPSKEGIALGENFTGAFATGILNMVNHAQTAVNDMMSGAFSGLNAFGSVGIGTANPLVAAGPSTVSLDPESLAALQNLGGVSNSSVYNLNNQSPQTELEIENAFAIMEMLGG